MLTDFLIAHGVTVFLSGWMQFGCAFALTFLIMIVFGKSFIRAMHNWQKKGQPISENVPESHRQKAGTPTMGGILLVVAILVGAFMFMSWERTHDNTFWLPAGAVALLALFMFGAIGFIDDYKKVTSQSKKASNGLSRSTRLIAEAIFVVILAYLVDLTMPAYMPTAAIALPFKILIPCGIFYYIFAYFVICGSANATNITDGLDGMLSKLYMPVLIVLLVSLYGATRTGFMDTALILPETSSLYPVLGATFGGILGFLWYNAKPAAIFMGDTGSLALGGFMGTVAMLLKTEIIMGVAAGMFVLILLSSFIQTMWFKATRVITGTGKRIFLRAPLHHHFEELGWPETKIVDRFFVLSILFSGLALMLLKFA